MSETETRPARATDLMAVDIPEGTHGRCAIERFEISANALENVRNSFHGRGSLPGTYTRLTRNGRLWMSDTTAERRDHIGSAIEIQRAGARGDACVLIGGLGLGMIVRVALLTPGVTRVDVVEIDPEVIALVGPHYSAVAEQNSVELVIHETDLHDATWPTGTRWDVAWFDIWPDLCTDNLASMAKLRRSYGRRCGWHECWGRHMLLRQREQERRSGWW